MRPVDVAYLIINTTLLIIVGASLFMLMSMLSNELRLTMAGTSTTYISHFSVHSTAAESEKHFF